MEKTKLIGHIVQIVPFAIGSIIAIYVVRAIDKAKANVSAKVYSTKEE